MISRKEEFEAKIEGLKSALKWASTEEEDSLVINKIVTVLEHAIVLNELVKKNWASMEQRELDESNQEKSSKKRSKINDECDQFLKNVLPLLLNKFFKLAIDLESFMSHPQFPKAHLSADFNPSIFASNSSFLDIINTRPTSSRDKLFPGLGRQGLGLWV